MKYKIDWDLGYHQNDNKYKYRSQIDIDIENELRQPYNFKKERIINLITQIKRFGMINSFNLIKQIQFIADNTRYEYEERFADEKSVLMDLVVTPMSLYYFCNFIDDKCIVYHNAFVSTDCCEEEFVKQIKKIDLMSMYE
jgi:hypothetical protein